MSLYKREGSPHWWARFTHNGRRIQQSTGTADRLAAQQYHDKLKASLWEQDRLGVKPRRTWNEAVVRYLHETKHKATHAEDIRKLRWLDGYLRNASLDSINRDKLNEIGEAKSREASPATANRYLALARAILRKAAHEWEWMDRAPKVRMFKEQSHRVRWLTPEQAETLLRALPEHLADMVVFSLNTGLRQRNVTALEWSQINMQRKEAWIHADQAKARKAIPVPLNDTAVAVLRRQIGKHVTRVFTYRGNPVRWVNNTAWKATLERIGLQDFRWHDLRHTWASWHVQAGTGLHDLQQMGGWESSEMVKRYAHQSSERLASAAANIVPIATKMATVETLPEKERGYAVT